VDRTVAGRERRDLIGLVHDDHVGPAVTVHIGDLDVVRDLALGSQTVELRTREVPLPVPEQKADLTRVRAAQRRVDDVEISVAVNVGRGDTGDPELAG